MAENNNDSIFQRNIQRGIEKKIIKINNETLKITYFCKRDYSTSFKNPEEKVRASYFCELILDYDYPAKNIDIEVTVPRRTPEDRADIVVYDEKGEEYLVVECKKDGITDAEFKQAIEQSFGNANSLRAKFASVVAGITKTAFNVAGFKQSEREKNVISDIPKKYGKTPKYKFLKGESDKELKIISREDLIKALEKAHDTIWQGGKLTPTVAFDEVAKLLFCKLRDEKDTKRGEPYEFQIGTHEMAEEVFVRLDEIYQRLKSQDSEVFKEEIKLDPKIVYSVVEHLQSINFSKTDLDTKGVAFERFLGRYLKGDMGQYFTPREIIKFCIKILKPKTSDLVLDPACGTGGFLLNCMDYVKEYAENEYPNDLVESYKIWHDFAKENLYGIEISDQIARVAKANMIIHEDGHTNIISTDSLKNIEEIADLHLKFKLGKFDLILTNPPFGADIKETKNPYLKKYELGKNRKSQKTEVLFIERCLDFLKPDGKMAIVLPDGILTNSSLQYVRDFLMAKTQILAVVSLPQFAFAHFGAGVKSSLVFVRKKKENEEKVNYPIFMALAEHIGYDATGRKDSINDLNLIFEEYTKFEKNSKDYKGV